MSANEAERRNGRDMIDFECTVQEGCVGADLRPRLEQAVESVCNEVLGVESGPVNVSWVEVRKGFGFRGGEPSTTSLVRGRIPDGCSRETRGRLLHALGETWRRIAGAAEDEVIVSARDRSWTG